MESFNPRTRTGCDDAPDALTAAVEFQSTHPHGVRLILNLTHQMHIMFQSTHPHGVRLLVLEQIENKIIITSEMRI